LMHGISERCLKLNTVRRNEQIQVEIFLYLDFFVRISQGIIVICDFSYIMYFIPQQIINLILSSCQCLMNIFFCSI
jgi:hypothetical protein